MYTRVLSCICLFFFFKQQTAYEMRISDWSSDVCSSDLAVNRKSIVENLFAGGARVVHSACFPEQFGCDQTIKHYDYNVAKAKELLKEAGYPNGFSITLDGYRDRDLAEAMVGDLAKVGIKANLNYSKIGRAHV